MRSVAYGRMVVAETDRLEKRREARTLAIYREATLEAGSRVGLCVLKNLSSGGAMMRTVMTLRIDEPVVLVMTSGRRATGRIRWQKSELCGITFDTAIPPFWLLDRHAEQAEGSACRRLPRVLIAVPVSVTDRGGTVAAVTCDLSTHGTRLASDRALVVGPIAIDLHGLGRIPAHALWSTNGQSGCLFDRPFSVEDITRWLNAREAVAYPT